MSEIFNFIYACPFGTARRVRSMENQAQTSIKITEYHTMSSMGFKQEILLLTPWAMHLSGG